ncbi:cytochrome c-type biogenesis protein CcmH [Pelagibacteraceae bacterium]|nr:cytochrome c-type biogenesis protein CcmH [Pelagibacteraceae bacterium]
MILRKIIIIYFLLFSLLQSNEVNSELIEIYKNLRCLVCQGQSIADSNSDFASTIKLVVQDKIKDGKTKEEVYEFLISKYGEWIVYQPTLSKNNFLLWFFPYFILVLGGVIIFYIVRKSKHYKGN